MKKTLFRKTPAIRGCKITGYPFNNPFAVDTLFCTLDDLTETVPDMPVKHHQLGIHSGCDSDTG